MISKISAKRKANGLTITELRLKCFSWKFTRFWLKQPSIRNFQKKGFQKNSTIHGKTPVAEFLFFSFSLIFQKRDSSRSIFLWIFQNFLTKAFSKTSSSLLLLWLPNLSQQTKHFQSWQESNQYYDVFSIISGHAFTCLTSKIFDGVFLHKVLGFSHE